MKRAFTFVLEDNLREKIRTKAEEKGLTIAGFIRSIVIEYLNNN